MNFVSYEFLYLLVAVMIACWLLPHRALNLFLLASSYLFYGWWDWRFLSLLFISSVVDYTCGRMLDGGVSADRRKDVLAVSLAANLGLLFTFKYFDFFASSFCDALSVFGVKVSPPLIHFVLPVGISFYTFQTLSYTIDVYRRQLPATKNFFDFMLYVSFFPQLVAGPIERASHLLPQILKPRSLDAVMIYTGTQLVLVGFFKKMVIADNLAIVVNPVFKDASSNGIAVVVATYAFALQIYCDFSGYTDIARGVARMMGFDLCQNFNLPYFATSPSDFWRRWHISLSSWFRDYVYVPLGGNRGGIRLGLRNLFVTMLLAGLWHGARWNFVLWGVYHGVLLVLFVLAVKIFGFGAGSQSDGKRPFTALLKAVSFFQLTCVGWFLFRVDSLDSLISMGKSAVSFWGWEFSKLDPNLPFRVLFFGFPLILFQAYQFRQGDLEPWRHWSVPFNAVFYLALFYAIILLGVPEQNEFIYFQF
ncbi:MBOAT family O-acyltransferase [Roseiconus lacunae]|uniref:MBOAT family O-acyltransferase n=1 Tax=Roseiconus lacunae TaxID=2605694 RepID=UPI001E2A9033|nr:MBOAT family O-acyltransferase [Roseiconus lacunae]MCD0459989.1 MBOAT family protein [Roseiconus lacunae]